MALAMLPTHPMQNKEKCVLIDAVLSSILQVVTRQGRVMLMEYGYDGRTMEMFSKFGVDQSQEQYLMWLVKTLVLPTAYW
jgi:hypothetical protein